MSRRCPLPVPRAQCGLYVSGPMSGLPDYNYPAFMAAAEALRGAGYRVHNPAEVDVPFGSDWTEYMRADIALLCDSNGVALLDGWWRSRGASLEVHIAKALEVPVEPVSYWLEVGGAP